MSILILFLLVAFKGLWVPRSLYSPPGSGTSAPATIPANWKTYTNSNYGYSFMYPPTWVVGSKCDGDKDEMQNLVTRLGPHLLKFPGSDCGTANIPSTVMFFIRPQPPLIPKNYNIVGQKTIPINNSQIKYFELSIIDRSQGGSDVIYEFYVPMGNQYLVAMTGAYPSPTLKSDFNQIMSTFKFTELKKEINLSVKILPTSYGIEKENYQYPALIKTSVSEIYAQQIQGYGAGENVIIGPKGWSGNGAVGADGGTSIQIFPSEIHSVSDPSVLVNITPACIGCIWGGAAPFFPKAEKKNIQYMSGKPTKINGLVITKITDKLVKYVINNSSGFPEKIGFAYYVDADQPYFMKEEISLKNPYLNQEFANELLDISIKQYKLDK